MINSIRLRNNFSKVAANYETYATLQAKIADSLLKQLDGIVYKRILDIGMGTGRLTQRIACKYPQAKVFGCDFAKGMVSVTKARNNLNYFCADAENLCFKKEYFDLVISTLMYQWLPDLKGAFREAYRVLKNDGKFLFNCFGNKTLRELTEAFNSTGGKNGKIKSRLPNKDVILDNLKGAGFRDVHIKLYIVNEHYKDIADIIHWLKNVGANQVNGPIFIGKDKWFGMRNFYKRNFSKNGRVTATFEVIEVSTTK